MSLIVDTVEAVQASHQLPRSLVISILAHVLDEVYELRVGELNNVVIFGGQYRLFERLERSQIAFLHFAPRLQILQLTIHLDDAELLILIHHFSDAREHRPDDQRKQHVHVEAGLLPHDIAGELVVSEAHDSH